MANFTSKLFQSGTGGTDLAYMAAGVFRKLSDRVAVTVPLFAVADHADRNVFVADRAYILDAVRETHTTASTSGTLMVKQCSGTTAPASGTDMLASALSTAGAANTVVTGTKHATKANLLLAAGDRVALVTGGTATNYAGGAVTITLRPV